jgi:hypothetical protein
MNAVPVLLRQLDAQVEVNPIPEACGGYNACHKCLTYKIIVKQNNTHTHTQNIKSSGPPMLLKFIFIHFSAVLSSDYVNCSISSDKEVVRFI